VNKEALRKKGYFGGLFKEFWAVALKPTDFINDFKVNTSCPRRGKKIDHPEILPIDLFSMILGAMKQNKTGKEVDQILGWKWFGR
jgi:hypothetical protein